MLFVAYLSRIVDASWNQPMSSLQHKPILLDSLSSRMPTPPKMTGDKKQYNVGSMIVPNRYCRIVLPFDILAKNIAEKIESTTQNDIKDDKNFQNTYIFVIQLKTVFAISITSEWCKCNPPPPHEYCPRVHPILGSIGSFKLFWSVSVAVFTSIRWSELFERICVPGQLQYVLQIVANWLHIQV